MVYFYYMYDYPVNYYIKGRPADTTTTNQPWNGVTVYNAFPTIQGSDNIGWYNISLPYYKGSTAITSDVYDVTYTTNTTITVGSEFNRVGFIIVGGCGGGGGGGGSAYYRNSWRNGADGGGGGGAASGVIFSIAMPYNRQYYIEIGGGGGGGSCGNNVGGAYGNAGGGGGGGGRSLVKFNSYYGQTPQYYIANGGGGGGAGGGANGQNPIANAGGGGGGNCDGDNSGSDWVTRAFNVTSNGSAGSGTTYGSYGKNTSYQKDTAQRGGYGGGKSYLQPGVGPNQAGNGESGSGGYIRAFFFY